MCSGYKWHGGGAPFGRRMYGHLSFHAFEKTKCLSFRGEIFLIIIPHLGRHPHLSLGGKKKQRRKRRCIENYYALLRTRDENREKNVATEFEDVVWNRTSFRVFILKWLLNNLYY